MASRRERKIEGVRHDTRGTRDCGRLHVRGIGGKNCAHRMKSLDLKSESGEGERENTTCELKVERWAELKGEEDEVTDLKSEC